MAATVAEATGIEISSEIQAGIDTPPEFHSCKGMIFTEDH